MMPKLSKSSLVLFIFTLLSLSHQAQNNRSVLTDPDDIVVNRDSTWGLDFDFSELEPSKVKLNILAYKLKKLRAYNDSMMMLIKMRNIRERSDSLEQLYDLLAGDSTSSYNAYSFFAGQFHASVSGINSALSSLGWPKFSDKSIHLTNFLDFTWKRKHFINEVFMSVGIARTVSKGDISITYNYKSPVNYNIGYCLVDKKRVQVFPFAGLLYQTSTLDFVNNSEQLFDLKNYKFDTLIKATSTNKRGVEYNLKKRELVLNYGLEVDFHLIYSKRRTGFIVGLRGGGGLPLLSTGWSLDGGRYSQFNDLKIRNYYLDLVLRVYLRRHDQGPNSLQKNWWESYAN